MNRKKYWAAFGALIFLLLSAVLPAQDYNSRTIISVEKTPEITHKLAGIPLDFLMEYENRVFIHASFEDMLQLQAENIPYRVETQKMQEAADNQPLLSTAQGGVNGAYHSYSEVEKELLELVQSYPDISALVDLGDSLEGRNIYGLKISDNVTLDEGEAAVIFLGCHHAREWISVEVPLLLGKYLVENYATNPQIKALVDKSEIWIIPLLNPDGLEYSIHFYRYWRKNRRDNGNGNYGVDINRNYGYMWGIDNNGSSPNPASDVYRGSSAFSEPETQAVRSLFAQKEFQALVSYHSYSQIILYPWGYIAKPSDQDNLFLELAGTMSGLMEPVNGRKYGYGSAASSLYLTNGDITDWSFGTDGIPSFTIELPPVDEIHGGFFNSEEDISSIFNENLPAALYLIDWGIQVQTQRTMNSSPSLRRHFQKHSTKVDQSGK